jgi:hypothetical protein
MRDHDFWKSIADSDFAVPPGHTASELSTELLDYLRDPDPVLRDEFGYTILTMWLTRGVLSDAEAREMLTRWTADLDYKIGEQHTDSVIVRSFAALMLSILIYRDNQTAYLTDEEYRSILDKAIGYLAAEKDLRGYDAGKGFMHSCAHTSDILKFAARSKRAEAADLERILDAISAKVTTQSGYVYIHSEDVRMAMAVMDVLKKNSLSREQLAAFVSKLAAVKTLAPEGAPFQIPVHSAFMNTRNLMRSLYFRIVLFPDPLPGAFDLKDRLLETMKEFNDF